MKSVAFLCAMMLLLIAATDAFSSDPEKPEACVDCHKVEQDEFRHSRMAVAAQTPAFINEWHGKGKDEKCLNCHAPSGGDGVACIDCHDSGEHPYPKLKIPQACARCHDAPGEITVGSFRDSPAARQGKDCLDCHLQGERSGHDFTGPSRPGFLQDAASLNISMRRDRDSFTALILVRHNAGHALPGGTTGRAVWLLVEERDREGKLISTNRFRFGWQHDANNGWVDQTLPAGPGKVIELPISEKSGPGTIQATLIYRFLPGGLEQHDPDQVTLARTHFGLPKD